MILLNFFSAFFDETVNWDDFLPAFRNSPLCQLSLGVIIQHYRTILEKQTPITSWHIVLNVDEILKSKGVNTKEFPHNPEKILKEIVKVLDTDTRFWSVVSSLNADFFRDQAISGRPIIFIRLPPPSLDEFRKLFRSHFDQIGGTNTPKLKKQDVDALLLCCGNHFRSLSWLFLALNGFEGDFGSMLTHIARNLNGIIPDDIVRLCLIGDSINTSLLVRDSNGVPQPFANFMQQGVVLGDQVIETSSWPPRLIPILPIVFLWKWATQKKGFTPWKIRESTFQGKMEWMIDQLRLVSRDRTGPGFERFHATFLAVWSHAFPGVSPTYDLNQHFVFNPTNISIQEHVVKYCQLFDPFLFLSFFFF